MKTDRIMLVVLLTSIFLVLTGCGEGSGEEWRGVNGVDYVVVIGVDALSPDGIQNASTPYLDYLVENGASTLAARAVMPTNSSPNWASMIMGAGPEQHGVTSNSWERDDFDLSPTEVGPGGFFPTIFSLFPDQRPDLETVVFYDWPGFGRLFEEDLVNLSYMPDLPRDETEDRVRWAEDTMENAVDYVADMQPGRDLGPFINTYDTAATIAWIFGLEMPESWIARPAKAVFQ